MSEPKTITLIAVPTAICVVAGFALAFIHGITKEPIAQAQLNAKQEAIAKVLPEGDEGPIELSLTDAEGGSNTFYIVRKNGVLTGVAVEASSPKGYNGDIAVMVGINLGFNQVEAVEILSQQETPGLGANCTGDKFRSQFAGRDVAGTDWRVKKDGGVIDAITAATITSRAATEAVAEALKLFSENQDALIKADKLDELAPIEEVLD